jgi:predicted O-methyltransferase YrrM
LGNRTLSIDDRVYDYLLSVSLKESDLLAQLRMETAGIEFSEMQIAPEQGQFMAMLVKLMGARRALEIGTFTGYSSVVIATALPEDGELVCCDDSEEWTSMARKYWQQAGLEDRINFKLGDASKTLQAMIDEGREGTFDFIFIDADKQNYPLYYELSLKLLRAGGLIAQRVEISLVTIGDGLTLVYKPGN